MVTRAQGRVLAAGCAGAMLLTALAGCSSSDDETTATTTTSSAVDDVSAAGKDCVAFADELPGGAPEVPIEAGPPPTELVVEDLKVGEGPAVPAGATVTVDYIGVACSTGMIFDDSYSRGQQATFGLDQVISGWSEGLVGMQAGGQRLLVIPPELGYGSQGAGADIKPGETLYFVVTLDSFE